MLLKDFLQKSEPHAMYFFTEFICMLMGSIVLHLKRHFLRQEQFIVFMLKAS